MRIRVAFWKDHVGGRAEGGLKAATDERRNYGRIREV